MPVNKARQKKQEVNEVAQRSRVLIAVAVVLSLVGVWTVLAYSGAFNSASGEKEVRPKQYRRRVSQARPRNTSMPEEGLLRLKSQPPHLLIKVHMTARVATRFQDGPGIRTTLAARSP
jgi:hypothetical protein